VALQQNKGGTNQLANRYRKVATEIVI